MSQKFNKRTMTGTIPRETKREGQRKAKDEQPTGTKKKGEELVPLVVGSYLTHGPWNVACKL